MSHISAGLVLTGSDGYTHVRIWGKSYFICPKDMGILLFAGETVPLLHTNPDPQGTSLCSGSVALNPSGRAVIIAVGEIRYMLPRDRFIAVALGEDVSCILFEVPSDVLEPELLTPLTRGATS